MKRPRHPRIACLVPHCPRGSTRFPPGTEIICATHYRKVDPELLRARRRIARRIANARAGRGPIARCGRERRARLIQALEFTEKRLWARIADNAIERGAGL